QTGRTRRRRSVPERRQDRSFHRAAAELGASPSAISQALRALKPRVGAAVFLRMTRSVCLTEAGERFLLRAKPTFEELAACKRGRAPRRTAARHGGLPSNTGNSAKLARSPDLMTWTALHQRTAV